MELTGANEKLIMAFFDLLENDPYSKISVTELIAKAGCSRTTFYRYYTDVLDMYNKVCEILLKDILIEFLPLFLMGDEVPPKEFGKFCDRLGSQEHYIRLLCGKNGGRRFFEIALEQAGTVAESFSPDLSEKEKFTLRFLMFSGIGTYVKVLMDGEPFDKKFIVLYKQLFMAAHKEV